MKFNKQFAAYVETQKSTVPGMSYVEFKRLKKLLKHCALHHSSSSICAPPSPSHQCPPSCAGRKDINTGRKDGPVLVSFPITCASASEAPHTWLAEVEDRGLPARCRLPT